jgi:hypothetical protein
LGFRVEPLGKDLVEIALGPHSFLLQNFLVEQWASNVMMHLLVSDVDAWWKHIAGLDLPACYGVPRPKAPKLEEWGLKVAYVIGPVGVRALAHRRTAARELTGRRSGRHLDRGAEPFGTGTTRRVPVLTRMSVADLRAGSRLNDAPGGCG